MDGATRSHVPVALGSATPDTEEGRAFLQDRLGLYAMWLFVFSGTFYLINVTLTLDPAAALQAYTVAHLGATLVFGALWGVSRLQTLSTPALQRIDAVALVAGCTLLAVMGGALATVYATSGVDPTQSVFMGQLAVSTTVLTRAVAVPSTPTRTGWTTLAALVPQVAVAAVVFSTAPVLTVLPGAATVGEMAFGHVINIMAWCGVAVTISTVASRIIFGLRATMSHVKRLGQYTLEEKIGAGGMGIVYRASHAMLRRPTAIKLLSPDRAGSDGLRRFEREVRLTATLTHPSTVAIFDYGQTPDGLFYYAMEYLDGLDLEALVRRYGPLDAARVIHVLEQVSGALTEAHEVGLIHRDIKPANIILCERGGVPDVAKVVDFGLVKQMVPPPDAATMAMTTTNVLTGTPLYMAPEVVRGVTDLDGRSDLYSLGAVGYYLLTGAPIFDASSLVEVLAASLHTTPVLPSERTARPVPADLEAVIMRCLAKVPAERFATSRDLGYALRACADTTPWSVEAAAAWWRGAQGQRRPRPPHKTTQGNAPTLDVDLEARGLSKAGP